MKNTNNNIIINTNNNNNNNFNFNIIKNNNNTNSNNNNNLNEDDISIMNSTKSDINLLLTTSEIKKNLFSKKTIIINILFGQFLALISVSNGFISQNLEKKQLIVIPLLLTSTYYLFLFIIFFIHNNFNFNKIKFFYIIITLIDSQANFLNVYVFNFIKFDVPFLINFTSTIWSVIFTILFIKKYKYLFNHKIGITISLVGTIISFIGSFNNFKEIKNLFNNNENDNNFILGIIICFIISILYGINGILQEIYLTNSNEIFSFFVYEGLIGFFITFLENFLLGNELGKIINKKYKINFIVLILWILFVFSLCLFTFLTPFFIQKCSANMFNINLITTIFWSFLINIIFISDEFKFYFINIFFIFGFFLIIYGMILFNSKEKLILIY